MTIRDFQSSSYKLANDTIDYTSNTELGRSDTGRVLGRQLNPGNIRGNMSITGTFTVQDPSNNNPVITSDSINQRILVSDPITRLNRIVIGKLPDGTYGIAISKTGEDVLNAFS